MFFYETVVTHPLTQKFGIFEYLTEYLLLWSMQLGLPFCYQLFRCEPTSGAHHEAAEIELHHFPALLTSTLSLHMHETRSVRSNLNFVLEFLKWIRAECNLEGLFLTNTPIVDASLTTASRTPLSGIQQVSFLILRIQFEKV
jgi:hypothetical protein